jgi:hypothetical protein
MSKLKTMSKALRTLALYRDAARVKSAEQVVMLQYRALGEDLHPDVAARAVKIGSIAYRSHLAGESVGHTVDTAVKVVHYGKKVLKTVGRSMYATSRVILEEWTPPNK